MSAYIERQALVGSQRHHLHGVFVSESKRFLTQHMRTGFQCSHGHRLVEYVRCRHHSDIRFDLRKHLLVVREDLGYIRFVRHGIGACFVYIAQCHSLDTAQSCEAGDVGPPYDGSRSNKRDSPILRFAHSVRLMFGQLWSI